MEMSEIRRILTTAMPSMLILSKFYEVMFPRLPIHYPMGCFIKTKARYRIFTKNSNIVFLEILK